MSSSNGMKHFTSRKDTIRFDVDGEPFEVIGALPAEAMKGILEKMDAFQGGTDVQFESVYRETVAILRTVLLDESAERFIARLASKEKPITLPVMTEVVTWLIQEVYQGERPTPPPSSSTEPPSSIGPSSTDGAPPAELTPAVSPGLVTSTSSTTG